MYFNYSNVSVCMIYVSSLFSNVTVLCNDPPDITDSNGIVLFKVMRYQRVIPYKKIKLEDSG